MVPDGPALLDDEPPKAGFGPFPPEIYPWGRSHTSSHIARVSYTLNMSEHDVGKNLGLYVMTKILW